MPKQVWVLAECDEGALKNKLNELDEQGYMPWELRYIDVEDSQQDPINLRKAVRIIAHAKSLKA